MRAINYPPFIEKLISLILCLIVECGSLSFSYCHEKVPDLTSIDYSFYLKSNAPEFFSMKEISRSSVSRNSSIFFKLISASSIVL